MGRRGVARAWIAASVLIGCSGGRASDGGIDAVDQREIAVSDGAADADATDTRDVAPSDAGLPADLTQALAVRCALLASCPGNSVALRECANLEPSYYGLGALEPSPTQRAYRRELACAAAATSCSAVAACLAGTSVDYCTMHPGAATACVGNTLIDCGTQTFGVPFVQDCTELGQTCGTFGGVSECSSGAPCDFDASAGAPYCAGNALTSCNAAVAQPFDCNLAIPPSTCATIPDGGVRCIPADAPPCAGPEGTGQCAGTTASDCIGGHTYAIDCAAIGAACLMAANADGSQSAYCGDPSDGGTCMTGAALCAGTHLQICTFSEWRDIDCTAIGFRTCALPTDAGPSASPLCVP